MNQEIRKTGKDVAGSSRRLRNCPILPSSELIVNPRTRRAGTPPGRLRSRLGSGERTGVRESIYESGKQERFLQFLEGVAQMIEDIARQKRSLALIAVENCDLRCATA